MIVFTRLPVIGEVKTRLFGHLAPVQTCALHQACLLDAVALANKMPRCRRILYVAGRRSPARELGLGLGLSPRAPSKQWGIESQRGADLGARMRNALLDCFRAGCSKAILIGTDTPWMGRGRLELALRALDRADVVLGPTEDGGYYMVGARRLLPGRFLSGVFRDIEWGTSRVLRQTVANLRLAGISFRLLARDFDLDRPEDLARASKILARNPLRSPALAKWIAEWKKQQFTRRQRPGESSRRPRRGRPDKKRRPGRA